MEDNFQFLDEIRCLYFDDEEDQRNRFKDYIERSWKELKNNVSIKVDTAETPEEGIKKLKESSKKYHIFFVDILVEEAGKRYKLGYLAIKNARQDDKDLAIIALTVGNGIHEDELKRLGCDKLVFKGSLLNDYHNLLGKKMLEALEEHNIEPSPSKAELIVNEIDFPLVAVLDTVGRKNFINLVEKILDASCAKIEPSYIKSGLSGAHVLRAVSDLGDNSTSTARILGRSILLKMSKEEKSLKNELSKDISGFPTGLFIPFIKKDDVVSGGDWFAIGSSFKDNALTFLDWLKEDKTNEDVKNVLFSLFNDTDRGLVMVYNEVKRNDREFPNTVLWNILNRYPYRKAMVQIAIEEFLPFINKYDKFNFFNQDLIDAFLSSERIDTLDKEKIAHIGTSFCLSHGDLHSRNILISENGLAYLIDPANINTNHWASDIARLSVDLIVSAYDSGEKSYYFEKMDEWCNLCLKFINGENLSKNVTGDNNIKVCTALDWIRTNMSTYHGITNQRLKPEWEFRLALAVEFLRSAYRVQDLTAPKRVLGLLSACRALRAANTAYDEFKNIYGE